MKSANLALRFILELCAVAEANQEFATIVSPPVENGLSATSIG